MKVKSILASLGACAIAVSAMAVTASADVNYDLSKLEAGDDNYTCYIFGDKQDGSITGMLTDAADLEKITAIKWTIECETAAAPENWYGGAFGINTKSGSWDAPQWAINEENPDKTNPTKINDTTYELTREVSFSSSEEYVQAVFQIYGDNAAKTHLKSVTLVGLDSVSGGGDKTDDKKDDATTTSTTTTTAANKGGGNAATSGAKTGDAGVGVAVGLLGLAGAAAVVSRKKH